MRPIVVGVFVAGCLASFGVAAQTNSDQQAVEQLLANAKTWTFFWEQTDQLVPSTAASKGTMEFFRRDGKLFGRTTHMISGNCEFEVVLRADGFTFEWCGGYRTPQSSVSVDPADAKFPFKNVAAPRKVWFQPN
jgi:hypothetical protein